jgi:lincosamide nucleotidyltransferase A/C/D/E
MLSFNNEIYPSEIIGGKGIIGEMTVRCLTVEAQLLYHQGYEHKEKDEHDVQLLCKAFGLPIPKQYEKNMHSR